MYKNKIFYCKLPISVKITVFSFYYVYIYELCNENTIMNGKHLLLYPELRMENR